MPQRGEENIHHYSPTLRCIIVLVNTKPVNNHAATKKVILPAGKVITHAPAHFVLQASEYHRIELEYSQSEHVKIFTGLVYMY